MRPHVTRRTVLAGAAAALAGCTGGGDADERPTRTATETPLGPKTASAYANAPPTASSLPVSYGFQHLQDAMTPGGPPKDGIPSIDDPVFVDPAEAPDWLTDEEVVFGVVHGDDVKAYPQKVLVWHEICNDVLDGTNVAATYCPLTGTAMGFERGATTFGVTGMLLNANLVMYDRATDTEWPQMLATAIQGWMKGDTLREFRLIWTSWGAWKRAHPDTVVLSDDTGHVRNYGGDPYGDYTPPSGYYTADGTRFTPLASDDRLPTKHVVLGTRATASPVAFDLEALRNAGSLAVRLDGQRLLAVHDATVDDGYVYRADASRSVESVDDGRVTLSDGSVHPAAELPFERVYAFDAMWMAWVGYYPETALVRRG